MRYYQHSKDYLTEAFEERSARNPSYSMRAFARDLGLGVSTLTELIKGKYGLSRTRALSVAKKLGLAKEHANHLADLFLMQNKRAGLEQQSAALRVEKRIKASSPHLSLDSFKAISNWYHMAILELTEIEGFVSDSEWMSKRLGLSVPVLSEAVERLIRLGLLQRKRGKLRPRDGTTAVGDDIPSEAIQKFHRQILEKAHSAIERHEVTKREISSTVFSIDVSQLPEAKQELLRFRRSFARRFSSKRKKNDVYCLSMQLFSLLEDTK